MDQEKAPTIIEQAVKLAKKSSWVHAVGIAGSVARGTTDPFSDMAICVLGNGDYLPLEDRGALYTRLGFTNPIYEDVNFETSRGDGFAQDGSQGLHHCLTALYSLFQDTIQCARQHFYDIELPVHWRQP